MIKNKKAAIGSAMTWVVATFIILLIVVFFIYSSYILAKKKQISTLGFFELGDENFVSMDSEQTLLAILKTKKGETTIRNYIVWRDYMNNEQIFVENILNTLPALKGNSFVYIGNYQVKLRGSGYLESFFGEKELDENIWEVIYD
jgi:hypothetical protein